MNVRMLLALAAGAALLLALPLSAPARPDYAATICEDPGTYTTADSGTASSDVVGPSSTFRRLSILGPDYGGCSSYDWDVSPSYTGDYYTDATSADAAEPPAPAPVTPALPTWRNLYDWPNGHGYVGWHTSSSSQPGAYGLQSNLGGNYGLWLWPVGGTSYGYSQGQFAEWNYTAPGTTRLSSVALVLSYKNKLLAHHCIDVGFRDAAGAIVTHNEHCVPVQPPDSQRQVNISLVDPASNPTSKVLYFRIRVDCGGASTCSKNIPQLDPLSTGGYARLLKADAILVDDDLPVVTASGEFRDLDENYDNGRDAHDLTIAAADAGAGIVRNWLERVGSGTVVSGNAPCDPTHNTPALDNRICPPSYLAAWTIDMHQFPEGTNVFVGKSIDPATNVGLTDTWTIYVDRTPPAVPSGIQLEGYDGFLRLGTLTWGDSADPALPDGVPGSGLRRYLVRYQVNGGGFGDWRSIDATSLPVGNLSSGDRIDVEVQALDAVDNASASGSASIVVPAAGATTGPVLTGSLADGNGAPLQGEVAVYLNGADNVGQVSVGIANAGADGSFTVPLSPEEASAVAAEAIQNSGWVNFDVIAISGSTMFSGDVARKIDVGAWTDGNGTPDPFEITLAPGAPGVVSSGTAAVRRLSSSQRRLQLCPEFHYAVATTHKMMPVGELHTGDNQTAYFEYGDQADSVVQVGISEDGKIWKVNGSFHVSNEQKTSTGHGVIYPAGSNFGRVLLSDFQATKYQYFLGCNPNVKWFKTKVTKWLSGQDLGADVSRFDHQCLTTYNAYKEPFLPGGTAYTHGQKAWTWDGGVEVFGASLDIRSGFSRWAHSQWHFGRKFTRYWLCGNDRAFVDAPRIFAGG